MNHWRSQHYLQEGRRLGVPPEVLGNAAATAKALRAVNSRLPPVLTLRHLAQLTDVPYGFLRAVASRSRTVEPYRVFKLKKKGVGHATTRFRYICVPHPLLLRAQRWIHKQILRETHSHEASHAYDKDSHIIDSAKLHCGCRWMVKLDITNFFESILEADVYRIFRDLGYQPLIAFELGRLCTRLRHQGNPIRSDLNRQYNIRSYKWIGPHQITALGHLPQGAPTSPILSNLAMHDLDSDLMRVASNFQVTYTRYADDLTFSTPARDFSRNRALKLVHDCYAVIRKHRLWPNRTKTKILSPRARKIVLGLLVDRAVPSLTREYKDALRMHIHFLLHPKIGPVAHSKNRGFDSVLGLQHHVFGLAAFATGIERRWGSERLKELSTVKWPTAAEYFP